jgi:hypothetical protein
MCPGKMGWGSIVNDTTGFIFKEKGIYCPGGVAVGRKLGNKGKKGVKLSGRRSHRTEKQGSEKLFFWEAES